MTRKLLILPLLLAFVVLSVNVVPMPAQAQDASDIGWVCPEEFAGQQLNVFNWSLYISEAAIPNFEELCDVKVVYDTYDTTEAVFTRLREGNPGFDVVFLSDFMVTLMGEEDLLEPLDLDLIPNFANIGDEFKDPAYDPGNVYSVPYLWGSTGISYNVERVDEITSWNDLFDYDGPVAWMDEPTVMLGVALLMNGHDPNSVDSDEIAEARDYLIDKGGNVRTIAASDGTFLLETGEVDIIVGYSGELFQILTNCECDDFAYAIPEEGGNIYVDTMTIPTGARNPELAHAFIDYMLDPVVGAANANEIGYASPNQVSIDMGLIDPSYLENGVIYLEPETIERLFYITQNPEGELDRLDAWDEVSLMVGE
ncbi:MAG: spermidine/putrescine ABC transporter substrate-binding protein [Anaerolineales bacterium]|nr:spermidine/putrescine ABC transporter substrate-binding protein [Anaerolineales bacterium]